MNVDEQYQSLIQSALEARRQAYCPYSQFAVGACLLCADGRVYTGCNIENASYGATICAERTAFAKAIGEGERQFVAIAVVGGLVNEALRSCVPCGLCLQFMREFCGDDFVVVTYDGQRVITHTLAQLMPVPFAL